MHVGFHFQCLSLCSTLDKFKFYKHILRDIENTKCQENQTDESRLLPPRRTNHQTKNEKNATVFLRNAMCIVLSHCYSHLNEIIKSNTPTTEGRVALSV
jgi:hypothetical protein